MPYPSQVLVVDDEPAIRQLLRRILEPEGYRVSEAGDGSEALRKLKAQPAGCPITHPCTPREDRPSRGGGGGGGGGGYNRDRY